MEWLQESIFHSILFPSPARTPPGRKKKKKKIFYKLPNIVLGCFSSTKSPSILVNATHVSPFLSPPPPPTPLLTECNIFLHTLLPHTIRLIFAILILKWRILGLTFQWNKESYLYACHAKHQVSVLAWLS